MKDKISEALAILRSEGIRIPHAFTRRLKKKRGHTLSRADIKNIKNWVSGLTIGDHIVLGIDRKHQLSISTYEGYVMRVKNASNARKVLNQKTQLLEAATAR